MSTTTNLTDWYPADVNPVRPGVYEVDCGATVLWYSLWDGEDWISIATTPERARWFGKYEQYFSTHSVQRWRGLASDPLASRKRSRGGCILRFSISARLAALLFGALTGSAISFILCVVLPHLGILS